VAAVTASASTTCPGETPPSRRQRNSTGAVVASSVPICSRLDRSLPRTISTSRKSVIKRSTNVRRSFSCATAVAAASGAKNSISVSCSRTKTWNKTAPNRARVPISRTSRQPIRACHAVHIKMKSSPAYTARAA
jgi:hypothetical protein